MNLEPFKTHLKVTYNSEKTIENYYGYVERFFRFATELNKDNIEAFVLDLKTRNKSQCAIDLFLSAIKKYMDFTGTEVKLPKYRGRKRKKDHPHLLEDDIKKVVQNSTVLWPCDYREREFVITLMFYSGLRPSEVLKLSGDDIDFKKIIIHVREGKGQKDRKVRILNKGLYDILYQRRESKKLCGLTYKEIYGTLKKIQKFLKLKESLEPRTLRRSFANFCLSNGIEPHELQVMMGHESIDTTMMYTKLNEDKLDIKCKNILNGISNDDQETKIKAILKELGVDLDPAKLEILIRLLKGL